MKIFPTQLPIFRGIFLFTLTIASLLSAIVSLSIYFQVGNSIENMQKKMIDHGANELQRSMETFLTTHLTVLSDHAKLSILSQGVMQPESMRASLVDFMAGLQLLGKKSQLVLLDYRGRTIYAKESEPSFDYSKASWVGELLSDVKNRHIAISDQGDHYYWRLAVPIAYNNNPEGVLVAEVAVAKMDYFSNASAEINDYSVDLFYNDNIFVTLGPPMQGKSKEVQINIPGFSARYHWDNKQLNAARYTLIQEAIMGVLLAVLLSLFAALFFAERFFVKPLQQLRGLAHKFTIKTQYDPIPTEQRIEEISNLAHDFNAMMDHVQERQDALKAAKDTLELRVNERTAELTQSKYQLKTLNETLEIQINERTRELEMAHSKMVMQEKMASVGQLAAGIAHELNNPINFVRTNFATLVDNFADLLEVFSEYKVLIAKLEEQTESPELTGRVRNIEEEMNIEFLLSDIPILFDESQHGYERIANIIESMLNFSRMDQLGEQGWANINKGIQDTLVISRNEYKYHTDIHTDFGEIDDINCSLQQLNQVFLNIIINSAQAIESQENDNQGAITIRTWQDASHVHCQFSDNGPGIPSKLQSRIFEPFFTTKDPGEGTGLGLSISYDIVVQKHGGKLELNCPKEGGTVFTIALPRRTIDS